MFLAVTLLFAWYRHSVCLVWDDSPNITGGVAHTRWLRELQAQGPAPDLWQSAGHLWQDTFGYVCGGGYRPLSTLYSLLTYRLFMSPDGLGPPSLELLFFVGTIYGALAVCVFCLGRRFSRHTATALFATLLVMASPPLAATAWVVMTGVQAIVPLLICLALVCYFKTLEPGRHWGARLTLIAILFFGPWFREFLGIVPLLIGFLELERGWRERKLRPTLWMGAASLALVHAMYPTALMKMAFFPDLPLKPVFAMGNLAGSLDQSEMRWFAAWHFLPLFPPSLLAIAVLSQLMASCAALARRTLAPPQLLAAAYLAWLALSAVLLVTGWCAAFHGLLLCLVFAVLGALRGYAGQSGSTDPFVARQPSRFLLPVWFLAAFLPLLRVFTEHIHFLYAVVPAAIVLAREAEACWAALAAKDPRKNNLVNFGWHALRYSEGRDGASRGPTPFGVPQGVPPKPLSGECRWPSYFCAAAKTASGLTSSRSPSTWRLTGGVRAGARYALIAVFALISADQTMNLVGALRVNQATYGGIQSLAEWFKGHVPAGSLVVSNVIHSEEIKWHSGGHFENYWTVAGGVCDGSRVVDQYDKLARLLAGRGGRDVYFLDLTYDYLPRQAGYHRHKFVKDSAIGKEPLGLAQRTRTRYFFLDPLRHLVAREYVPFLGAPDLVNDFFTGPPHHRWPFRYEVYADYRVYRVLP